MQGLIWGSSFGGTNTSTQRNASLLESSSVWRMMIRGSRPSVATNPKIGQPQGRLFSPAIAPLQLQVAATWPFSLLCFPGLDTVLVHVPQRGNPHVDGELQRAHVRLGAEHLGLPRAQGKETHERRDGKRHKFEKEKGLNAENTFWR